ncbi:MAG TPA: Chromate resistance protein ChrB [Candidatus Limnocylindrales bacterium]|nr:Chromate resistance protein ChrB [Candidatus Limnocylindrales bacterium]
MTAARWLVLTWRLPASSSTPRVATWRKLQRLGAAGLTPGAAIVPYSEHLLEQLEWIAEEIVQRGGEAYVLPVTELPEADEKEITRRIRSQSSEEYTQLRQAAEALARRPAEPPRLEREIGALERGLARAVERDYFGSVGRSGAQRAIKSARKRTEG